MRIIAGQFRGLTLASVGKGDPSAHLRPTSDRVRESIFNVLTGGRIDVDLRDARVLDLFAGTGALGLEALSRGARHVTFVESGAVAQRLIHDNIASTGRRGDTTILKADATRLPIANAACDLVFLDPPYGKGLGQPAIEAAQEGGWIAADAVLVWEENAPQAPPPGFTLLDHRRYGDTHVTLLRAP